MIIKVHGTSGSGKTTAVRNLMELGEVDKIGDPKRPEAYRITNVNGVHRPIFVLGSYEGVCGGMDTISKVADQIALIHDYAPLGHVVYEGLLISTYYGALGQAMEQYGKEHVWAFLDTPIDVCIERVKARRAAAGNTKPLNERNTRERIKPINSLKLKLGRIGARVETLSYDSDTGEQLRCLLA